MSANKQEAHVNKLIYISLQILRLATISMNFIYSGFMIIFIYLVYVLLYNLLSVQSLPTWPILISYSLLAIAFTYVIDFITIYFSVVMFLNLIAITEKEGPLFPFRKSAGYLKLIAVWTLTIIIIVGIPTFIINNSNIESCIDQGTCHIIYTNVPPILFMSLITFLTPLMFYYRIGPLKALSIVIARIRDGGKLAKKKADSVVVSTSGLIARFIRANFYNVIVLLVIYEFPNLPALIGISLANSLNLSVTQHTIARFVVVNVVIMLWFPFVSAYSFVVSRGAGALSLFAHTKQVGKK